MEDERRLRGQREDDGGCRVQANDERLGPFRPFQTLDSCRQMLFMENKVNPEWISFLSTGATRITVTGGGNRP